MLDSELYKTIHRKTSSDKKDRFKLAIQKSIEEYVDKQMKEEDPSKISLIPTEARRQMLKSEAQEDLDLTEFAEYASNAIAILRFEGTRYLSKENYELLVQNLDRMKKELENLNLNQLKDEALQKALQTTPEVRTSILKVAIDKYSNNLLPDSLSIFAFLTALDAEDPDYWYRFGLVAEESERYDAAANAFATVTELAENFIDARAHLAFCDIYLNQEEMAKDQLNEIKNILKSAGGDVQSNDYVIAIENRLAANKIKGG